VWPGRDPMSNPKRCPCGQILQGRQRIQCAQCYLKQHPGSSQCAICLQWYMSHGGKSHASTIKLHATGKCKKEEQEVAA
jgi:hypothetical protein